MKLRLLYILSSCAGIAAGSAPAWALDGAALYKTHCSACHEAGDQRAPARSVLKQLSPQQVITALEKGAMIAQGAERSRAERRVLAEYLSGKPLDEMKNPIPNTAENLAEARAHWADHCAICHANNGGGNTTIGQNLYPKAPDMRQPRTQNVTDGELYYTIQNGIRLSGMPAWGQAGENDEDSWKLVHFIRHLPQLAPEEEREMERLNPKGPEERQEQQEEEQFLNEDQSGNQAPKPPTHHNH